MKVLSLILAVVLMQAVLLAPVEARVQSHSPHAAKSVHKHHAKQVKKKKHKHQARPKASLKSCMDRVGMNMVARDRCMRQHCEGRWGK
ncbi:MAG: hypothetical protein LBF16_04715, partial [Pseudomonadales bacterium]|nr:hypothetical protein [Pseudomonadales bacterium]